MGKEKGRQKNYLRSFQVIVLGSNIAAVTQECTLLWEYLFDQINSNLVIMQNVSHWIYLIMWESATASSVFSLLHPQKLVKTPVEGAKVWKMCLENLKDQWENWVLLSVPTVPPCSVKCPSSPLQPKALRFCDVPLLMPEEGCSAAPLKLHFYEQYRILETRKHKAMGIV